MVVFVIKFWLGRFFFQKVIIVFNQEKIKALFFLIFKSDDGSNLERLQQILMAQFCCFSIKINKFTEILIQEYGPVVWMTCI